jgi:hypothetical protein
MVAEDPVAVAIALLLLGTGAFLALVAYEILNMNRREG